MILVLSTSVMAGNESRSMRAPDGAIVSLGDSRQHLIDAFKRDTPISVNNYVLDEGRNYGRATDFVYRIGNSIYTITLLGQRVYRISWVRA